MSESTYYFEQFRAQGARGRYPFTDRSTMTSREGQVIPDNAFTDARLYPPGGGVRQGILTITRTGNTVVIVTGDATGPLCQGTLDLPCVQETLPLTDSYGRVCGLLTGELDNLRLFTALPVGTYTFELGAAELVPSCVVPQPQAGVTGILLASGELFTGDVYLVGEDGVVVRSSDSRTLRIDVVGDPLFVLRVCQAQDPAYVPQVPLVSINSYPADAYGNFSITAGVDLSADTALRIDPVAYGIQMHVVGGNL